MIRTILNSGSVFLSLIIVLTVFPNISLGSGMDANNVVIVLDASGSMDDQLKNGAMKKMDAAKVALIGVLEQIPQDTNIGLLVFSARNINNDWLFPLGPRNDNELVSAINRPIPGGKTPLGEYIKKGTDALLKQREKQFGYGTYRLLVVTDGEANDPKLVEMFVPEVLARGITMDVIGVDMAASHTLATKVHSYREADDPASLKQALTEVFAEIADTGTDSVEGDAFSQIAPIPDKIAAAMIQTLTTSGNQPIGKNKVATFETAQDQQKQSSQTTKQTSSDKQPGGSGFNQFIILIIIIVFVLYLKSRWKKRG